MQLRSEMTGRRHSEVLSQKKADAMIIMPIANIRVPSESDFQVVWNLDKIESSVVGKTVVTEELQRQTAVQTAKNSRR